MRGGIEPERDGPGAEESDRNGTARARRSPPRHRHLSFSVIVKRYAADMFNADGLESTLNRLPPGPELAAALDSIDVWKLSGYDRVVVLRAYRRMSSHYAAQAYRAMASISEAMREIDDVELVHRAAATEIRAGLTPTRRAADCELELAMDPQWRLPPVWAPSTVATSMSRRRG